MPLITGTPGIQPSDVLIMIGRIWQEYFFERTLPHEVERMAVGHSLGACTTTVDYRIVNVPPTPNGKGSSRLILVDTPGFDNEYQPYQLVIRDIVDWVQKQFPGERRHPGGIVFLHDISTDRFLKVSEAALRALRTDLRLPISIATTKGGHLRQPEREHRIALLKELLPRCVPADTMVHEFDEGADGWAIVRPLLDQISARIVSTDVVLLVTGLTGSGRSTFINALLPQSARKREVGLSLVSCTKEVDCVIIDLRESTVCKKEFRLVLVDTPGFDDRLTLDSSALVLREILKWLHDHIPEHGCRGGVIYLHDMTSERLHAPTELDLSRLDRSLNSDLCSRLMVVTTKWGRLSKSEGEERYRVLQQRLARLLSFRSNVHHLKKEDDAWGIVGSFLSQIESGVALDFEKGLGTAVRGERKPSSGISALARIFGDIVLGMLGEKAL